MNEFIVWSKTNKKYLNGDEFVLDNTGNVYFWNNDNTLSPFKRYELFNYIGINDINNNKIYADCSIVEFQWTNNFGNIQTDWGVFRYDLDYLQYLIYEENEDINKSSIKDVFNLKIIDTIQENKLGLIK